MPLRQRRREREKEEILELQQCQQTLLAGKAGSHGPMHGQGKEEMEEETRVKLPFGPGRLLVAIIKPFCFQKLTFYTTQNAHHKLTTAPCAQEAHRPGRLGGGRASILGESG